MRSMVNNHPFVDGNKRMAAATTFTFLYINGFFWDIENEEMVENMVKIAAGNMDIDEIEKWIQFTTLQIDEDTGKLMPPS